ncbi:MAG: DUF58 domain-containing protein [Pseudomonadota bacterium]
MTGPAALRAEAEALARSLPRLSARTHASEAAHLGSAGRRKPGTGEDFWQYRRYAHEDAAQRIDWRRSARGDNLYVRETELETARTFLFWSDPHPGFTWRGGGGRPTKSDRAQTVLAAMAVLLSREGERVGVLGADRPPGFGKRALDRLCEDLVGERAAFPERPKRGATAVLASDFYDPPSVWKTRLSGLAETCRDGVLFAVADPVEIDFPFAGRVKFSRPGDVDPRVLGRAETVKEAYDQRFAERRAALRDLAGGLGWRVVEHVTGDTALEGAGALAAAIDQLGDGA